MALNYKKLHDPINEKELNGINSILRTVTEYNASITLDTVSEYGLFSVTDDTLVITGGMPTAVYTLNNELIVIIDEDGEGELLLTDRLDSKVDLKITFPPYYTYKDDLYLLTLVADQTSIYPDGTLALSATLLAGETPIDDTTITLYQDGASISTQSTNSNGVASFTVQNLSAGNYIFNCDCIFAESNAVEVSVVEHVYDLELSSTTSIIQSSDSAIVTASLTRDGSAYTGQTLNYQVKHDNTVLASGTVTTASDGTASISYTGTGVGDVIFEVDYDSSLKESYEIIDAVFYDPATTAPAENTWIINSFTTSYSSTTGTTLTSESFATCFANLKGTGVNPFDWDRPCCIEFDITNINSENADFQIYDNTNNCTRGFRALGITGNNDHVRIVVGSNKIRYFVNDVEQSNLAYGISMSTFRCGFRATGTLAFKNFVIYPITDLVLSCSTPIIETGGNASITASLTHAGGAYIGETLTYTIKHDNTVLDSGSDTTNNNGEVEIQYTGTGIGEVTIEVKYGENLVKTYNITDCIVYDNMLTDTTSSYIFSTNQGNSLASQSDGFLFTAGSSARYFQRQYNNADSLIGKTIRFELTGIPSNQWRVGIFAYANGEYTNIIGEYTSDGGTIHLDYTFDDENTEHALFRTYVNATAHTLKCKDFKVYPV